jgi:hypothetical protein
MKALFERDLDRLRAELDAYSDDDRLWQVAKDIKNSAGNLIMHICGNLHHYIGAVLSETGYVRDRDFEFTGRVAREELERGIDETKRVVGDYFASASEDDWAEDYPANPLGSRMSISHFLIHLYGHLHYHLGQVNYHRRFV